MIINHQKNIVGLLKCKLGKHTTLYHSVESRKGFARNQQDECIYCGKKYVWVYLGRADNMYNKCEVLNEPE